VSERSTKDTGYAVAPGPAERFAMHAAPKATSNQSGPAHFAYIDAVRGFAFLGVFAVHSAFLVGPFPGRFLLAEGGYGVQLFFLASAITLCNSMSARRRVDPYPTLYFYLRRLFRIGPLFWVAMACYWTIPQVMPHFWLTEWAPFGIRPIYFVLTGLFLHGWHPYTFNSIVPGGWSIAVEMNFYLLFPLLYFLLGRSLRKSAAFVLASIIYINVLNRCLPSLRHLFYSGVPDFVWTFFKSFWLPSQLPVFLIGFLTYHLIRNDSITRMVRAQFWAACIFGFCCMAVLTVLTGREQGFIPGYLIVVLAFAGCILAISRGSLSWIVNPVICYIGRISYSCYLVHFAALGVTLRLLGLHITQYSPVIDTGHALGNLLLLFKIVTLALILTAAVATLTLQLIENPGIALGKKLLARITAAHPNAMSLNEESALPL
jgi:peptidoglycan/LPS O-acetylase OafA/YrhL